MDLERTRIRVGLRRANGVLTWRGVPENHPVREHLGQFREIVAELDRCFREASLQEIDALNAARDRVVRSIPELLRNRSEKELFEREAEILEALLETTTSHVRVWSELRRKVEDCYASLTVRAPAKRKRGTLRKRRHLP